MNEEERIDAYLTLFKELEKELVRISKLKDDYVSFSRALNHIYYNRLNPVIAVRDNYDFLKTASDLRNILSHENDVCSPTEDFLNEFRTISKAILSPFSCFDVCTKNVDCGYLSMPIEKAAKEMDEKAITHLPIVDEGGKVVGVFSRSTLFDAFRRTKTLSLDSSYTLKDIREDILLQGHSNEDFFFVPKRMNVLTAFKMILKKKAHDKTVGLLFVTENGKQSEKLLGVISAMDLAKLQP